MLTFVFAGALMSAVCVGFAACNELKDTEQKESPEKTGITPVPASDVPEEVAVFFEKYLPPVSSSVSEIFFVDEDEDKCLMINSNEKLKAIVNSSVELPVIDFGTHSLIIGQQTMSTTSFRVLSQNVDVESNYVELDSQSP